jgi:hypothetical protein
MINTLEKEIISPTMRTIDMEPVSHNTQGNRRWLSFPLLIDPEWRGTRSCDFVRLYPRIIQWKDGLYYSFRGTHSKMPEYGIKGDNVVFYREILVDNGEKLIYFAQ